MAETKGLSANMEDYLEAIYNVVQKNGAALPRDIGNILDVGRSSVSGALKTLRSKGLIRHESYGVITLTERGEVIAREVNRRHEALKEFFVRILNIDDDLADKTACSLEHTVGDKIMARLVGFVRYSDN
jgi:DtxR family Mn-dependent transcriptional regulator